MSLLLRLLGKRKALSMGSICASALAASVTLWWNARLAEMINAANAGALRLDGTFVSALLAMLAMGVCGFLKGAVSGCAGEYMTHDLRMGYARHFQSLPQIEVEQCGTGEHISRIQNEMAGVSEYLHTSFFQLVDDGVRFAATLGWLLVLNPTITLAANLPVLGLVAYILWSSKKISGATEQGQRAKGEMNRHAEALLSLFPIVRLYDAARMALDGFAGAVGAWEVQTIRAERTRALLMSLSAVLSGIPLLLLFLVGGRMVLRGLLSIGTLYVFINLSGNVSGALMNMPGHVAAFRRFSANMRRLSPLIRLAGKGDADEH